MWTLWGSVWTLWASVWRRKGYPNRGAWSTGHEAPRWAAGRTCLPRPPVMGIGVDVVVIGVDVMGI
eukprot:3269024-Pyramimonas_sp.AAC.1